MRSYERNWDNFLFDCSDVGSRGTVVPHQDLLTNACPRGGIPKKNRIREIDSS